MVLVSEEEYNFFRKIVFSTDEVETRLRAQVVVLYEKEFSVNRISKVIEKPLDYIYNLLLFIDYFGIEDYLVVSYIDLEKQVNDEYFLREQRKARLKRKSCFFYLFWPVTSIFYTIRHFNGILIAFFAWVSSLFSFYEQPSKTSNIATFEKGASNNYLIQINHLTINENGESENIEIERVITNTQWQLQEKIKELIISEKEISFKDYTVDSLIAKGRKKDREGRLDRSQVHFYAGLIVAYLVYSSSFKGGVWSISFLGVVIAISFKSWLPNNEVLSSIASDNATDPIVNNSTYNRDVLNVQKIGARF